MFSGSDQIQHNKSVFMVFGHTIGSVGDVQQLKMENLFQLELVLLLA